MHLLNAAFGEEPRRGSITRRKEGDVILVSDNPLATAGEEVADLTIELVVVGGRVLKQSPSLDGTVLDSDLVA
jgi:predicted amidohydrolase YtcJ